MVPITKSLVQFLVCFMLDSTILACFLSKSNQYRNEGMKHVKPHFTLCDKVKCSCMAKMQEVTDCLVYYMLLRALNLTVN
jgi:hypothetical protein